LTGPYLFHPKKISSEGRKANPNPGGLFERKRRRVIVPRNRFGDELYMKFILSDKIYITFMEAPKNG
jgi:hypothetical protein